VKDASGKPNMVLVQFRMSVVGSDPRSVLALYNDAENLRWGVTVKSDKIYATKSLSAAVETSLRSSAIFSRIPGMWP
jgi:hypothetical protein